MCPMCNEERKNSGQEERYQDREIVEILEELQAMNEDGRDLYRGDLQQTGTQRAMHSGMMRRN